MKYEVQKIIIKEFNEYLKLAEKRKVVPFLKNSKKKLPQKYQTKEYRWNAKNQLIDLNGIVVPSNPIVAGTPRLWRINGQDIYNQKIKHSARGGIMDKLHKVFDPIISKIDAIEPKYFPLTLEVLFHIVDQNKIVSKDKNIDNDNRWIYEKVIQDSLSSTKRIPDDNPYVINENIKKTIFVDNPEDSKLEIIIYGEL